MQLRANQSATDEPCKLRTGMPPNCSSPSGSQYTTSQHFALVHRPVSDNAHGNASKSEDQQRMLQDYQLPVNDWTLRGRLGLGNWKCGRCTGTQTTCPNGILRKNRDQIDSLIGSMVCLTQTSPELISNLERLAQLAHCASHRRKDPHDNRKTKWLAIFPAQNSGKHNLEAQVKEVFDSASTECAAAGSESKLCGEKVGGRKVQNYRKTIGEIIRLGIYFKDSDIDRYLRILERNIYCRDHELKMPLKKRDSWKSKTLEIRRLVDFDIEISAHCQELHESESRISAFGSTGYRGSLDQHTPTLRAPLSPDIYDNTASFWPEEFDTTPFRIIPRRNGRNTNTLNEHIRSKIERDLSAGNRKSGYIYVIEAEKNQGFVKLGYTSLPAIDRLKMLSFQCNRQLKLLFPTSPESAMAVPNALRVEELCHAELVDCQTHIDCTGCLQEHKEWFQISPEDAITVVRKWSAWMDSSPYDPELGGLKEKEKRRIAAMHNFMHELAEVAT